MNPALRILHLEDLQSDADLVSWHLTKGTFDYERLWVTNKTDFEHSLHSFDPDIVLSDHSLPTITSTEALALLKGTGKKTPFILVTATVSEEFAVSMMKAGIDDYILKDRMQRLPIAISNAIKKRDAEVEKEFHDQETVAKEKKFRALLENMSEAIILVDETGKISYHSPAVKRTTGFEFTDTNGLTIFDFIFSADVAPAKELFGEMTAKPAHTEVVSFRMKRKEGHVIWVEGSITNLLHDESVKAFIVNYRDVTERKLAEAKQQKSEADLHTIFNNTKIGYLLLDTQYKIVSFNQIAKERYLNELDYELQENSSMWPYLEERRDQTMRETFQSVMGGKKINYETRFPQANGSQNWYNIDMFPVRNEFNKILGMIVSTEDITARKNADLEKERMTSDIIQHNKNLEQFAYIVSHNLRSPVANILGLSTIIKESANLSTEDLNKCLDGLVQSVAKLDAVITDLNFILQTRREIDERKEIVNFTSLLSDISTSISELMQKQQVRITGDFEIESIFTVKSYLHSILFNLISNSIKYRNPQVAPIINISTRAMDNKMLIIIKDNGCGIDLDKHSDKIFGLYKKFHPHIEGKGMGLYMVKTQVEILGGKISLWSAVDKGSEFTIEFENKHREALLVRSVDQHYAH